MTLHQAITEAVKQRKLTAYFIATEAKRLNGGNFPVSINHVSEYLAGRKDMTGKKLDWVLRVLGLEIVHRHI